MKTIEVTKDFAFAEQGIYVTEYSVGDVVEVSDECADLAIKEKWGKPSKKAPIPATTEEPEILDQTFVEQAAVEAAPENTATAFAPEIK